MNTITPTPYDDVFRTMVNDLPRITLKLINEMFSASLPKKYTGDERVEPLANEMFLEQQDGAQEKRITDARIRVIGTEQEVRNFHIECQSSADGTILIRMFEYDSQIALQESEVSEQELVVNYPQSGVLYLRWTAKTPDNLKITINTPGGSVSYEIPAVKIGDYTVDDVIKKDLYFLIPFYLFRFEALIKNESSPEKRGNDVDGMQELRSEFLKLRNYLDESCQNGKISEFERRSIRDMLTKVADNLSKDADTVKKEVEDIMGGRVLEYEAKTIFNEGGRERARRIFRNMLNKGKSVEEALDISELDEDDVRDLISPDEFQTVRRGGGR